MGDTSDSSWRRVSDVFNNRRGIPGIPSPQMQPPVWKDAQEPEARILIVDIDMQASDTLQTLLQASGYSETRVAYSGHAALAVAEDFQPSVVLVALDLLDMSGYELIRLLRAHAPHRDSRLIAMTSGAEHVGHELARVRGFERYLTKPIVGLDFLNGSKER